MVGGFMVGRGGATVQVRASGPSPAAAGVPYAMANATLTSPSGQTVPANDDDWASAAVAAATSAVGLAPPNTLESAALPTLPAGTHTAILPGGGRTRVGIGKVFDSAAFGR
jgi:hypothetical protein